MVIEFDGADVITTSLESVAVTVNAVYNVDAVSPETVIVVVLPDTAGVPDNVELVNEPPAVNCWAAV